jgi:DNA polymerase (family X)
MENSQIASALDEIADLLALREENEFRIRSYRDAARTVRGLSERIEDMAAAGKDLTAIANIGDSMADKLEEMAGTGKLSQLEELRDEMPAALTELMDVPGLGPKKTLAIYEALNITGPEELRKACENHEIQHLEGMGPKTEENILEGLKTLETQAGRMLYPDAAAHLEKLRPFLDGLKAVRQWEVTGSFRRRKETIGDLDILLETDDREALSGKLVSHESVKRVIGRGREKVSVTLEEGLQVDFRFFDEASFGAAMLYFTGSKQHNVALRKMAREKDWKLNEYGLFSGGKRLAGKTEESVYSRFGLPWIPPELRENRGEIAAAEKDKLPDLITADDLRGDLHVHTDATDGNNTIREMAKAARDRGYVYIAITDHSQSVHVAGGLDEDGLKKHAEAIRKANDALEGIHIFAGVEVDILPDGDLDLNEKVLKELDWVVASVHYTRNQSEEKMTDRLAAAIESGVVHCLGHPLGRIIGKRKPLVFTADKVFEACIENQVAVEIDAQPDRMDLPDTWCRDAKAAGLKFSIATDAHAADGLDHMKSGLHVARRGWLEKEDVLNTRTEKQLRKWMKR